MTRQYKQREMFTILCRECSVPVKTNSYRTLMCPSCSQYNDFKKNMLNYKWRLKKLLAAAKNRATAKNVDFNLTHEFLISLWENQNGKCAITHRQLDLQSYGSKGQVNPNAPSIDRIIPSKGYVIDNVRLVIYHINVAMSDFGIDELRSLARDILGTDKNGK